HPRQQLPRVGQAARHAGDEVTHLARRLAAPRHLGLHPPHLGQVRPVQVPRQRRRRLQRPPLPAAVPLVVGRGLVKRLPPQPLLRGGKKPPPPRRQRPSRGRAATSVGCP